MAVIFLGSGTRGVGQQAKCYVWWQGQVYRGPIVFQASPFEGEVELTDHAVMETSISPPPGLDANALVHSFVVRNIGSVATRFELWSAFSDA